MKKLADAVAEASRRAGAEIRRHYEAKSFQTTTKADQSPVTSADLAAHDVFSNALAKLTPGVPIVSEESGSTGTEVLELIRAVSEYWLVDPLDGTRDFLQGTGEFCTCVALVRSGRPVLGVIHAPATGLTYSSHGEPALRTRAAPQRAVFLVSRSHPGGEEEQVKRRFGMAEIRRQGSALKYAQISAGQADVAVRFTPTSLWDVAAGQAILEAAGGAMRLLRGGALDYSGKSLTLPAFVAAGDLAMLDRVADQLVHALD